MKIDVTLAESWAQLKYEGSETKRIKQYIIDYFTVEDKKKKNTLQRTREDGKFINPALYHECFYVEKYNLLPSGFINDLKRLFDENIPKHFNIKVDYKFRDGRKAKLPKIKDIDLNGVLPKKFKLRDYQIKTIKKFFKTNGQGMLEGSVASGKTLMFGTLCKMLNVPTLIFVHKIDLAIQGIKEFTENFGFKKEDVGIVQGNNVMERKINFVTIQSVKKINPSYWERYQLLIVDEVHNAKSPMFQRMLRSSKASFKLGVSGTITGLDTVDYLRLKSFFGDVFYEITSKELIDKDVLADPIVKMVNIDHPDIDPFEYGSNWQLIQTDLIVNNDYRNDKIKELADMLPKPLLILIERVVHGEKLQSLINGSKFVYGIDKSERREELKKALDSGNEAIVIASRIWNEGVNMRELASVIIAGGMKSYVTTVQRAGRVLRKGKKDKTYIVDFMDNTHRILTRHSRKRLAEYKKMGLRIK